jgi:hypothetical protein
MNACWTIWLTSWSVYFALRLVDHFFPPVDEVFDCAVAVVTAISVATDLILDRLRA